MLHIWKTNNATYLIRHQDNTNGQSIMWPALIPRRNQMSEGEDDDSLRGGGCGLGGWAGVKDSGQQCTMGTQADTTRMLSRFQTLEALL